MLLTVDVGNSNITFGVFKGETLCFRARLSSVSERSADEYAALFYDLFRINKVNREDVTGCMMASVVPSLTGIVEEAVRILLRVSPLHVGPGIKTGFRIRIDDPSQLGADLAADTAAALAEYGAPVILIDAGTVTTMAAVDKTSAYLGGAIFPGPFSSAQMMKSTTALLPSISLHRAEEPVIGKNSADAMRLGLLSGSAMMIDGFIERFRGLPGMENAAVIATGGSAALAIENCTHKIRYDRDLTLKGLRHLYQLNTVKK